MDGVFYLLLSFILALVVWYSWNYGITPTPTSPRVRELLLKMVPPDIRGPIVELGSGWGTLVFALARHFPLCKIEAYEISPLPYLISKIILKLGKYPNVTISRRDFFTDTLEQAGLVVCYLYPEAMIRLKAKFERELPAGAFVLSHTFAIPGWKPIRQEFAHDIYGTPVYLYRV